MTIEISWLPEHDMLERSTTCSGTALQSLSAISFQLKRPQMPSQDRLRKHQCLSNSQRTVSGMSVHLHGDMLRCLARTIWAPQGFVVLSPLTLPATLSDTAIPVTNVTLWQCYRDGVSPETGNGAAEGDGAQLL